MFGKNIQPHLISRTSMLTMDSHEKVIRFDLEDYATWEAGGLIQVVMPYLSPDDREFLMTGITAKEWADHFHADDE